MSVFNRYAGKHPLFKLLHLAVIFTFILNITPVPVAAQMVATLPAPGSMLAPTPAVNPPMVLGMTLFKEAPLRMDFIISPGDDQLEGEALQAESKRMINYFLAALTVPEEEMWVNLSPYEKDRIMADGLSVTEMGRDMLAQDYLLKQFTASLMYPEEDIGAEFWERIYEKSRARFGNAEIPANMFNKVWIVPETAEVYIHENNVFVNRSYLKVMLEEDYLALGANRGSDRHGLGTLTASDIDQISEESKEVIREVIIPEIEREVNEGATFTRLRQMFNAIILAAWYKKNLRQSVFGTVYMDSNKTAGIEIEDKQTREKIYQQYLETFKTGAFDLIKEDYDPATGNITPRKYFSGGLAMEKVDPERASVVDPALISAANEGAEAVSVDFAMTGERDLSFNDPDVFLRDLDSDDHDLKNQGLTWSELVNAMSITEKNTYQDLSDAIEVAQERLDGTQKDAPNTRSDEESHRLRLAVKKFQNFIKTMRKKYQSDSAMMSTARQIRILGYMIKASERHLRSAGEHFRDEEAGPVYLTEVSFLREVTLDILEELAKVFPDEFKRIISENPKKIRTIDHEKIFKFSYSSRGLPYFVFSDPVTEFLSQHEFRFKELVADKMSKVRAINASLKSAVTMGYGTTERVVQFDVMDKKYFFLMAELIFTAYQIRERLTEPDSQVQILYDDLLLFIQQNTRQDNLIRNNPEGFLNSILTQLYFLTGFHNLTNDYLTLSFGPDSAMVSNTQDKDVVANDLYGGIDFNTQMLEMNELGSGAPFQFDPTALLGLDPQNVIGIQPVFLNTAPITNFMQRLGLADDGTALEAV